MSPSRSNTAPQTATRKANVATTRPNASTDPQVESKTARKKRRKRERLAAEQAATQPALAPPPVTPAVAQTPSSSNVPFARSESHRQNNTSSVMFPSVHAAPPPLNRHPLVIPAPYVPTLPPKPSALTTSIGQNLVSRPAAFLFPQAGPSKMTSTSLSFARPELPTTPISDAASVLVTTPVPLPAIPLLPPIQKRTIGMPADTTTPIKHGLYAPVTRNFPAVNPTRALVMELLPRKFRNREFILSWAKGFSPRDTIRIDCNVGIGKALVQFSRAELAREAFEGPRLTGGEGREHIRVYWYRGDDLSSAPRPDLEEGEIQEDDTQDQQAEARPSKKKAKVKQKVVKKKVQSTPSFPRRRLRAIPTQLPSSEWAGRLRSNTAPSSSPVFMRPSLFNGWPYVDKSTSFTIPPSANLDASTLIWKKTSLGTGKESNRWSRDGRRLRAPTTSSRNLADLARRPRPIQATGA
ncbi:hypothetical protein B0H21DRAFT_579783 [Amylocystis lapponica]|nr:hypothetical protein B0H21DRAFT_579783 [Amylocystis lapponica]